MRLVSLLVLSTLAAATAPAGAQTLSPLTGSDAVTQQRTPDAARPAPAERPRRQRLTAQERFDAANTSHDGKLTLDQAKAANYTRVVNNFDAIDTKKNGYVTVEDIRAYNRAQRAARRAAKQQ